MVRRVRQSVFFTQPYGVEIREEPLPDLPPAQVLVATCQSAISAGTELLLYQGQMPSELPLDMTLPSLSGPVAYPLKYGYAAVGQVEATGAEVDPAWEGRRVFSFHPHESHFYASPQMLVPVPPDLGLEEALFLPNMETAVNLVMDGTPLIGERVIVFGQGVVGLLTTALLNRFPLADLVTLDRYPLRRQASLKLGAGQALDPSGLGALEEVLSEWSGRRGGDLVFELTGAPQALNAAISATGFAGRLIVGSWYGSKRADLHLGGRFHRDRIQLISSQVSTLAPGLSGRWNKARRLQVAWEMLAQVRPSHLITHRIPAARVGEAYRLIAELPEETIQVVLEYGNQ